MNLNRRTKLTRPIRFLQLNANRQNQIIHTLLQSSLNLFDILIIQEPWWGPIGNNTYGPVADDRWTPILPLLPIPDDERPRVMAYASRLRPDVETTLRSDLAKDLDFQILEIRQPPFRPTLIFNIYNNTAINGSEGWTFNRATLCRIPPQTPVIMTGDWNTHHPWWEPKRFEDRNTQPDRRSNTLTEWLREADYELFNEPDTPTYHSHCGNHASTIDLTFANQIAVEEDIIKEWTIDEEKSWGSDHVAIRWKIHQGEVAINNPFQNRMNFRRTDVNLFKEKLRNALDSHPDIWNTMAADIGVNADTIDQAVETMEKSLQLAAKAATPERRLCTRSREWWNPQLREMADEVVEAAKQAKASRRDRGIVDEELQRTVNTKRNRFR